MQKKNRDNKRVYSTDLGRICPSCEREVSACVCKVKQSVSPGDGIVRVGRSTKGRKGKGVTIITGIALDLSSLQQLAKELKRKCGSGGTVKDGNIEIQGDHRDLLMRELGKKGWRVKRSGG